MAPKRTWRAGLGVASAVAALLIAAAVASGAGPEGGLDARGWELASPIEKNGGGVEAPGLAGGASTQAGAGGAALAYGSAASFGEALGAPPISQYLASRGSLRWGSANLSPPLLSGTYAGGAYQLFSADLSRSILTNGWDCREGGEVCEAENPPLSPQAPSGYRDLYLREGSTYIPLVKSTDASVLSVGPEEFQLALEGASPDLHHIVFSAAERLYEWNDAQLTLLSATPGAALAAPSGAISADGQRVYFTEGANLYLREGASTVQVDEAQGGGGAFQAASADGSIAFFTKAGHLYRYSTASHSATDLTPGGGVQGVLAVAADGSYAYYLTASGLFVYHGGQATKVAAGADASNYPPAAGTARLSADGTRLAFLSSASLTGFPNAGKAEAYLYEAPGNQLICASCNPSKATPLGAASIPAARAAGNGPPAYRPRALSADGTRLFFESPDKLTSTDTDKALDVYEWEAQGSGGCAKATGCVGLISSGRVSSARFLDASADGGDAFFLTTASLVGADLGGSDVYDARAGGGYPEPAPVNPCEGDECQGPPSAPDDPAPGTAVFEGSANPPVHYPHVKKRHHKGKKKKHNDNRRPGHQRRKEGR